VADGGFAGSGRGKCPSSPSKILVVQGKKTASLICTGKPAQARCGVKKLHIH